MPLRRCDYKECKSAVERDRGNCMICACHRCVEHLQANFHSCPSEVSSLLHHDTIDRLITDSDEFQDDDPDAYFDAYDAAKATHLSTLLQRLNVQALMELASRLRDGIPCSVPAFVSNLAKDIQESLISSQMGGQNCHVDIHFADAVVWIARIRLDDPTLPPKPVQDHIFLSEVATLQFLQGTTVPVPKIYYHALDSLDNPVGVPIVLMEKMPGRALRWNQASTTQRTRVMEQLVDIFLELERYPFTSLGSMQTTKAGVAMIGSYAQTHHFMTPEESIGPFNSLSSAATSTFQRELEMIATGELSSLAVDNYLSHRWRLEVSELVSPIDTGHYYLKHFDDKGDHILVDDEYNITAIIDWEFASTESKALAFSSPCMMWPVAEFYKGSNQLAAEETEFAELFARRGRDDLSQLVLDGRKHQRFHFFLGSAVSTEQEEFEALFQGLRAAVGEQMSDYSDWKKCALEKFSDDSQLQSLLRQERRLDR